MTTYLLMLASDHKANAEADTSHTKLYFVLMFQNQMTHLAYLCHSQKCRHCKCMAESVWQLHHTKMMRLQ